MTSQTQSHGAMGERGGGWGSEVAAVIVVACGVTAARELRGSLGPSRGSLRPSDVTGEGCGGRGGGGRDSCRMWCDGRA